MRLGVLILPDERWRFGAERWQAAERLGFDSAWTYDHIWWRGLRDHAWFSAMPTLAAASAVTSRIQIGLMVASPNFRHPVLAAKDAIAIDDISDGRFVLGVGSGAPHAGDAEVLGGAPLTPSERAARFAEFVDLTGRLLASPITEFTGRFYSAHEARMLPGCVQRPRLPLAVAASGPAGIRLAARLGDAWITPGPANWLGGYTTEECLAIVAKQVADLRTACGEVGRDFDSLPRIMIATPMVGDPLASPEACLRIATSYAEVGMTELVIHWPRPSGMYAGDPRILEAIAADVLPAVHRL